MLTPSQICTLIKYVLLLILAAFLLYVIISYPDYRWYAVIFISLVIICRFQLWQYTPCDRERVRKEVLRRLRAAEDDLNTNSSASSTPSSAPSEDRGKNKKKAKSRQSRSSTERRTQAGEDTEPYGERDDRRRFNDDIEDDDDHRRADADSGRPIVQQVFVDYPTRATAPRGSAASPSSSPRGTTAQSNATNLDEVDLSFPPAANYAARQGRQAFTRQQFTPLRRNFSPMDYRQQYGGIVVGGGNRSEDLPVFRSEELAELRGQHQTVARSSPRRSSSARRGSGLNG